MGTAIKHPLVPERVKPSFVIFDIRALWRSALSVRVTLSPERQSVRMSKIRNDGLTHSGTGGCLAVNSISVKGLKWPYKMIIHAVTRMRLNLNVCHDIVVHLDSHLMYIMLDAVVHHSVDKHQHHITLKLGRCTDHSVIYVSLDRWQIHRSARHISSALAGIALKLSVIRLEWRTKGRWQLAVRFSHCWFHGCRSFWGVSFW